MDFSRPDNARIINTLKVLNALRRKDMSRSELSRELGINKVSISEITESLINDGLVEDAGKDNTTLGRPSTKLTISRKNGRVFSFIFSHSTITASASNLKGNILRFERFPKNENYLASISSFLKKMTADNPTVYGVTLIGVKRNEFPQDFFPWPVIETSHALSEARAEMEEGKKDKTLYISWSSSVEGVYYNSFLQYIPSMGHIKVTKGVQCSCGRDGCLGGVISSERLKTVTGLTQTREIITTPAGQSAIKAVVPYLVFGLMEAVEATGAERVVLTGEMSSIDDDIYDLINEKLQSALINDNIKVNKALKGDKSALEGAGIIALDEFFYHSDVLDKLNGIQNAL